MDAPTVMMLCALAFAAPSSPADGKKVVGDLIRNTVDKVLTVLKNKELSRDEKRKRVIKIIEPVVDFQLMAKLSLGRKHWSRLKPDQRKTFTTLFVDTLKATYFEKIDLFADEIVEFKEPVAQKTKFLVRTSIVSKGDRVEVVYKLYNKKSGSWQVYDFEIEGVSVVKSYGSQYQEFLRDGSVGELLARMRKNIDAAKKKDAAGTDKKAGK